MRKTYQIITCQTVWDKTVSLELAEDTHTRVSEETGLVTVDTPQYTAQIARALIGKSADMQAIVIGLDTKAQVAFLEIAAVGGPTQAPLSPMQVFRSAVLHNCSAVIISTNHPSGNVTPSEKDREAFEALGQAGRTLGIKLVDAVIVSPDADADRYYSLKEHLEITW